VPAVFIVTLISILIFLFTRKFIHILALLLTLFGTGITILLGKVYFHRVRPDGLSFYNETSYSFPSGHAVLAVAFYGLLFYSIIRHTAKYKLQWITICFLFMLLLGFSRVYLCVHYLSDVLAGYSLGLLWLLLSISIIEWKNP
jgi:undecaprenyl-diphosphatase